jgi:hypothetical protein
LDYLAGPVASPKFSNLLFVLAKQSFGVSEFTLLVIPKPILMMGPGHRNWPFPGLIVSVSQMEPREDNEGAIEGLCARVGWVSLAAAGHHVKE